MTDHITLPRSTLGQAIEALEAWLKGPHDTVTRKGSATRSVVALEALRAALAGAAQAEPVYQYQNADGSWIDQAKKSYDYNVKHGATNLRVLYTAPQPAQPVAVPQENLIENSKLPRPMMLAQRLEATMQWPLHGAASDELRNLHKENEALRMLAAAPTPPAATVPVLEPLTDAEIEAEFYKQGGFGDAYLSEFEDGVRFAEAAHAAKLAKRGVA